MVFLVKALRTGLGFASEAIHAVRDRPSSRDQPKAIPPSESSLENFENPNSAKPAATDSTFPPCSSDYPENDTVPRGQTVIADVGSDSWSDHVAYANQDELSWQLDDMIERLRQSNSGEDLYALPYDDTLTDSYDETEDEEERKLKQREALARELVEMAGPPPENLQRLPCPVIIPQRRPRNKDRGFVRAYAPILQDCGIDQEVFLQFLEYLDVVNHASAWIEVVFIAAQITSSLPFPAAMAVGMVLSVIAGTARELQKRTRANTFLEMVNRDLFMPRGLFVMVIAFKPDDPAQQGPLAKATSSLKKSIFKKDKVDLNKAAMKWSNPDINRSNFGKKLDNIRVESGETSSELELPETASLIYPQLDRIIAGGYIEEQSQGILEKFKDAGEWVNDYMDRRAMVFYEAKHPGSPMVVPSEQRKPMKSRFNDPDHPVNSGSIISLVTGGLVPLPGPGKLLAKWNKALGANHLLGKPADSQDGRLVPSTGRNHLKKVFLKNVLYLAVVNLPTEEEAEKSKAQFESMVQQNNTTVPNEELNNTLQQDSASDVKCDGI
ncbi:hypothetical protein N7447_001995 [Penicillium robsamsonii]|uniref:uncharacterized protein n=1 Tax=Penicillium robsamsonii TaxID=1792511 RepID=UPI00254950FB|nr:uncharacterized protein N7447_001995 [Penicillium robsamsonii]KAJ5835969.1 hypothetical protein N7447_001995 [Penicillium robsamsonii]